MIFDNIILLTVKRKEQDLIMNTFKTLIDISVITEISRGVILIIWYSELHNKNKLPV